MTKSVLGLAGHASTICLTRSSSFHTRCLGRLHRQQFSKHNVQTLLPHSRSLIPLWQP
ncbi:hypothetical protein AVDCRST_MAG94-529 [uncultured Leptolyngbya sp.]|uniref:Uncharacterized protein n=1 Tax=uncultured Leptolyngbya sp. TaxID=332963 RepID=A0A6J4KH65_9CYAN|nr:hypothetical protein AVDCRST_MAG94-529 [uncultured Leptolyngbya sp.]